ncbi:DMT family transporter [Longispora albida]|uniref:DMT family transporter n=1 Tax=Longispora albida TaxID=203523 RepID=UPI0003809D32|nr:DMT family transporter [Longispora albida]
MTKPHLPTYAALAVGIVAVSASGPMIAAAAAPALAIAFWRNAMAVGVLAPVAGVVRREELRGLDRRAVLLCVLAGVALAAHFATWVPSATMTSVATATALATTQPIWTGLFAFARGQKLGRAMWLGISFAVLGAVLATGADLNGSAEALAGDGLALLGGLFAAVYVTFGERVRAEVSTTSYTLLCYGVCGAVLLAVCLLWNVQLTGYTASTWLLLVALTAGPQLLGHSLFNFALKRVQAHVLSVLILLEVPGAALLGWAWLGQVPGLLALPGLVLLVGGIAVVVLSGRSAGR